MDNELGTVTHVTTDADAPSSVRVTVRSSPNRVHEKIRYRTPTKYLWIVPEVGDPVEVMESVSGERVAIPAQNKYDGHPSNLSPGDIVLKLNNSTRISFKETNGTYNVLLECDGDLQVDAANILVGEDGNRKKVATKDHTHDVTYNGGGDNSSSLTATTGGPSDITSTEVE